MGCLVVGRRGRYKEHLVNLLLKLLKIQRTVVKRRGQAEAVLYQSLLPGTISRVHSPDLGQCNVGLVYNNQKIVRKIVDQRTGRFPRRRSGQMTGIVLNSRAKSRLTHHLHVKISSL